MQGAIVTMSIADVNFEKHYIFTNDSKVLARNQKTGEYYWICLRSALLTLGSCIHDAILHLTLNEKTRVFVTESYEELLQYIKPL